MGCFSGRDFSHASFDKKMNIAAGGGVLVIDDDQEWDLQDIGFLRIQ